MKLPKETQITVWKTSDGHFFEDRLRAERYQLVLNVTSVLTEMDICWRSTNAEEVALALVDAGYTLTPFIQDAQDLK